MLKCAVVAPLVRHLPRADPETATACGGSPIGLTGRRSNAEVADGAKQVYEPVNRFSGQEPNGLNAEGGEGRGRVCRSNNLQQRHRRRGCGFQGQVRARGQDVSRRLRDGPAHASCRRARRIFQRCRRPGDHSTEMTSVPATTCVPVTAVNTADNRSARRAEGTPGPRTGSTHSWSGGNTDLSARGGAQRVFEDLGFAAQEGQAGDGDQRGSTGMRHSHLPGSSTGRPSSRSTSLQCIAVNSKINPGHTAKRRPAQRRPVQRFSPAIQPKTSIQTGAKGAPLVASRQRAASSADHARPNGIATMNHASIPPRPFLFTDFLLNRRAEGAQDVQPHPLVPPKATPSRAWS